MERYAYHLHKNSVLISIISSGISGKRENCISVPSDGIFPNKFLENKWKPFNRKI